MSDLLRRFEYDVKVSILYKLSGQDEMVSSEDEESGMESGVDTFSRSSSRREEREETPAEAVRVKTKSGESLDGKEADNLRKRKKSGKVVDDPKRQKIEGISCQSNSEDAEHVEAVGEGESEAENNNTLAGESHFRPSQPKPQVLTSAKSTVKGATTAKTPGRNSKQPAPPCFQRKVKKFNGTSTGYYFHACDDYNFEDLKRVGHS